MDGVGEGHRVRWERGSGDAGGGDGGQGGGRGV